jgi:hypothetical protein
MNPLFGRRIAALFLILWMVWGMPLFRVQGPVPGLAGDEPPCLDSVFCDTAVALIRDLDALRAALERVRPGPGTDASHVLKLCGLARSAADAASQLGSHARVLSDVKLDSPRKARWLDIKTRAVRIARESDELAGLCRSLAESRKKADWTAVARDWRPRIGKLLPPARRIAVLLGQGGP